MRLLNLAHTDTLKKKLSTINESPVRKEGCNCSSFTPYKPITFYVPYTSIEISVVADRILIHESKKNRLFKGGNCKNVRISMKN